MKKFKKIFLILVVFFFIGMVGFFVFRDKNSFVGNDLKLGVVTDKGLEIVSISIERKIISILKIDGEMQLWIPRGLGWYKSNKVNKILEQERKTLLFSDVFFYNFGFIPDKILFLDNFDDWKKMSNLGIENWLKFKMNQENMIVNEETLKGNYVDEKKMFLDENMAMSFADSRLINEESRMTIINTTDQSGLANFVGDRLDWAGFSVVSAENSSQKIDKCLFVLGPKFKESYAFKILDNLWRCEKKEDETLSEGEAELYLGEGLAQVLKYSNYVRTF